MQLKIIIDPYVGYNGDALILEDGNQLVREEAEPFSLGLERTLNFEDKLVLENGDDIIIENGTFADIATNQSAGGFHDAAMGFWNASIADGQNKITKVTVFNRGNGYISLPGSYYQFNSWYWCRTSSTVNKWCR